MASLPPQPSQRSSPQRHESPSSSSTPAQADEDEAADPTQSMTSVDSQTLLLNHPSEQTEDQAVETQGGGGSSSNDAEPRKCWICFSDETEDTPTTSEWKTPCPCALTAHEACLLDWVADLEAPQNRSRARQKIKCPQCKSEIAIKRPTSVVVSSVAAVERFAGKLTVPGIVVTLAGSMLTGAWVHGLVSVYVVFGQEDFATLMNIGSPEGTSARWALGMPLIPVVLVASRTTLADGVLPMLPILFFATRYPDPGINSMALWPPSAAMAFASLPYIRGVYNAAYRYLFAEKEKKWLRIVQPRAGENDDDEDDGAGVGAEDWEDGRGDLDIGGFELNLELEVIEEIERVDDDDVPPAAQQAQNQGQAGEAGQPGAQADGQPAAGAAAAAANGNNAPAAAVNGNEGVGINGAARAGQLIVNTGRAADAIMGALCFPAIAAACGELLRLSLPHSMTSAAGATLSVGGGGARHRPGLLQTRWGRSIVGGCLFVVVKDTLLLYSRYRLAVDHKRRRVVDFQGGGGKGVRSGGGRRGSSTRDGARR